MQNLNRCVRVSAVCAALLSAACLTTSAAAQYSAVQVASGLTRPVFVASAPGDYKRVFVVTKRGRIQVLDISVVPYALQSVATPFLDVTALIPNITTDNDERGLLGLAFHPNYQANGKFYIYYTALPVAGLPNGATFYCTIAEYTVQDGNGVNPALNQADPNSARIIMQIPHPQGNHNGGWIGFGPDGYLYIASGDGGNANDAGTGHDPEIGNGQDTGSPLGKTLRIDVNVTTEPAQGPFVPGSIASYGIPADNPTLPVADGGTSPSRREIWAYGLRNHYRNSFDRLTGDLWTADVGQGQWEEINYQPALTAANLAQVAGLNYGWRCKEGFEVFNNNGIRCNTLSFTYPSAVYSHGQFEEMPPAQMVSGMNGGCAIVGGYVYRGCAVPELVGRYIVGDYCHGRIYAMTFNNGALTGAAQITPTLSGFASFGEDSYGEMYIVDQNGGRVLKYVTAVAGRAPFGNCDHNRNGLLTVQDVFDFLIDWFLGSSRADFNGNPQGAGGVSVQDIFDFLKCYFRTCWN